jgi:hypothetical protein
MAKGSASRPFDRLRRDKTYGGYVQTLEHNGHRIQVRFHAESPKELQVLIPTALRFWKSRARWFKAFREYAVTELLAQLNGFLDCGEGDRAHVTAAQLRRLLPTPFSVQFRADSGKVYFEMDGGEDEDTLQENCFEVLGTLEDGITSGDVVSLI